MTVTSPEPTAERRTDGRSAPGRNVALLVASGDLRESANVECWPAQAALEAAVTDAFARVGWRIERAHPADGGSVFTVGSRVLVIDYRSPQTVLVDELPEFLGSTPG